MIYLVSGNAGSDVPYTEFGYLVNDAINEGQYTHQYGQVESAEDAIHAIDEAIDTSEWRNIPYCYNNNPSPVLTEILRPVIDAYTSAKPLNTVHTENGGGQYTAILNDKAFADAYNGWSSGGSAEFLRNTPANTSISVDLNSQYVMWVFTVLSTLSVTDGKFTFDTTQTVMTYSVSVRRIRADLWEWHAGQSTGTRYVPEGWLELNGTETDTGDSDPYSDEDGGGSSETGGGEDDQNNWDDDSDSNPVPNLPSIDATDAGFITIFAPTVGEMKNLANYMWTGLFDVNTFKKLFADPMDCILGLAIVPVNVAGSSATVNVGNISTGVSMTKASSQYVTVDCGTIKITEKLHSYLDYSPYRKASIFLPYIGTQDLDIDILNGATLGVVYHVDILTGGCTAYLTVNGNVVGQYNGQCSMNIPISGNDFSKTIQTICTLVAGAGSAVASGGMTAPATASEIAGLVSAGASTAGNVMNSKPSIRKSGSMGGSTGILGSQKPFLIIERPNLCRPANQNKYTGYPSYITKKLGSMSGFTQIQDIRLNDFTMTETERNELLSLLRSGVIL